MKNAKKIVTLALTAAIALSGALTETITADAAPIVITDPDGPKGDDLANVYDLENTTISMKVGETKKLELREYKSSYSIDQTAWYDWSTSDESIVSLENTYRPNQDRVWYFTIKAEKTGTTTIIGTNEPTGETISFTVTVKGATTKQKSCKHSWKTTKKATCVRSGVKTCKKCKLTKTIAKKQHKWVTYEKTKTVYDQYEVFFCNGCTHEDPAVKYEHDTAEAFGVCDKPCLAEFSEREYGSWMNAQYALREHAAEECHVISICSYPAYDNPHKVTKTVTECKGCGQTPEE